MNQLIILKNLISGNFRGLTLDKCLRSVGISDTLPRPIPHSSLQDAVLSYLLSEEIARRCFKKSYAHWVISHPEATKSYADIEL